MSAVFAIGGNGDERTLRRRGTAQLFHILGAKLAAHILGGIFERVDIQGCLLPGMKIADKQTACPLNGSDRAGAFSAMRPVI